MSCFRQLPSQRNLELGRVEGSGNLGHARSMCLWQSGGKGAQMSPSCWAGIPHSLRADTLTGWNESDRVQREATSRDQVWEHVPPQTGETRQAGTNEWPETDLVSKALCPEHSWQELAASQSQIQALTQLHGKEQASRARYSLREQCGGVRHRLACWGQYQEILFFYLKGPRILFGIWISINKHMQQFEKAKHAHTQKDQILHKI